MPYYRSDMKSTALALSIVTFASLVFPIQVNAQAPVVDVNQTDVESSVQAIDSVALSSGIEQRLAIIERIVDSRTESQQRMQMQLNDLQNDIDTMRGSIELHTHQLQKLLERQRELFLEIENRLASIQANPATAGGQDQPGDVQNTAVLGSGNEQASYQQAVDLILKDKDYDSAIPAFKRFLEQYPSSELSANAHYWLGQLLYNQQQYVEARGQFEQVVNKFENSPKRADSILKMGLIEKSIGNLSAANQFFNQVVSEYPSSTSARLASQQLAN